MPEQTLLNNKNYQKSSNLPLKLAFQANIFKYVEKKKRQLSVFANLNQNQSPQKHQPPHSKDKPSSNSSNLIKQNTAFHFYRPTPFNNIDTEILLSARIKFADRQSSQKSQILKKKSKGHKYTLSDWRILYDEREVIAQKHEMKKNSPDKMAVTDRLFYPANKQSGPFIQKNCSRHNIKEKRGWDQINQRKQNKFFVSDQNFFHMYHRSVTPIMSDNAEKKRIANYLNSNKERREIGKGLRLMNEGIFSEMSKNDVAFVPYKFQPSQSLSKLYSMDQNLSSQLIQETNNKQKCDQRNSELKEYDLSELIRGNKRHNKKLMRIKKQQGKYVERQISASDRKQSEEQNPELSYLNPSKEIGQKNHINLSELFQNPEKNIRGLKAQLRLRLFKPKRNKIQSGISGSKKNQSENKFANFQYSIKLPNSQKTSLITTKHSNTKWIK